MRKPRAGLIESIAEKLHLIPRLHEDTEADLPRPVGQLRSFPPPERWDDWVEYEATSWPRRDPRRYMIVPTTCFNCEAGCGLLSYIDKATLEVRKFEGNPYHPGSRGRNCAKGPATINQIQDPDRILYPLKRAGERGEGKWERISWDQALEEVALKVRQALREERHNEVMYHVGRPGHEGYAERILQSWGIDGHNSHTNVCSASARFGYGIWQGHDRPSPDYAEAEFILLISAHLESGHYFNPHAQRIIEGMMKGAELAVMDPRLSNTASMANYWLPTYPGSEAAVLLAMAKIILEDELYNESFLRHWVNWETYLAKVHPKKEKTFDSFISVLKEVYQEFTPEFAEQESGVPAHTIAAVARRIGKAASRLATHNWRSASSGNLGGWAVARALHFLNVLTGSVGTRGGTLPSDWNKFKPRFFDVPPAQKFWNELLFPKEYPLSHYEMSFLLPHFLKEGRGKVSVYFTRVFNPVWTYPDGFSWMEVLQDQEKIGLHVALTPTWNETAYFADYVLPMGHASERHDLISYETHAGLWIAFRQPVLREAARQTGREVTFTYEVNPGEVWEEDEYWIELSWRIDPDGSLGIRKHFISPYRPDQKVSVDEYYRYIFENTPGLVERAEQEGLTPLDYMRKYGAFEVKETCYEEHLRPLSKEALRNSETDPISQVVRKNGAPIGVVVEGVARVGFLTPSRKQEFYSETLAEWGWPEYSVPGYIKSHIHPSRLKPEEGEFVLVPTFRLPTLIHSRSGNAKWLAEISNRNPVWIHTVDAARLALSTGDLVRVVTEIGYFVDKVWVTEGLRPGIVACSHHLGRWRRPQDVPSNRWSTNLVQVSQSNEGEWKMVQVDGIRRYESTDPDSGRIFWSDGGVHQNLTFPVHPDPVSGMHCWHQKVRLEKARKGDRYGDVYVDTRRSFEKYKEWLEMTRPGPGPLGLRRPLWLKRPLRPEPGAFSLEVP